MQEVDALTRGELRLGPGTPYTAIKRLVVTTMTPERFYAALLCLYPDEFRREYGAATQEAFRHLRRHSAQSS